MNYHFNSVPKTTKLTKRQLGLETLENREMLSVNPIAIDVPHYAPAQAPAPASAPAAEFAAESDVVAEAISVVTFSDLTPTAITVYGATDGKIGGKFAVTGFEGGLTSAFVVAIDGSNPATATIKGSDDVAIVDNDNTGATVFEITGLAAGDYYLVLSKSASSVTSENVLGAVSTKVTVASVPADPATSVPETAAVKPKTNLAPKPTDQTKDSSAEKVKTAKASNTNVFGTTITYEFAKDTKVDGTRAYFLQYAEGKAKDVWDNTGVLKSGGVSYVSGGEAVVLTPDANGKGSATVTGLKGGTQYTFRLVEVITGNPASADPNSCYVYKTLDVKTAATPAPTIAKSGFALVKSGDALSLGVKFTLKDNIKGLPLTDGSYDSTTGKAKKGASTADVTAEYVWYVSFGTDKVLKYKATGADTAKFETGDPLEAGKLSLGEELGGYEVGNDTPNDFKNTADAGGKVLGAQGYNVAAIPDIGTVLTALKAVQYGSAATDTLAEQEEFADQKSASAKAWAKALASLQFQVKVTYTETAGTNNEAIVWSKPVKLTLPKFLVSGAEDQTP